LLVKNISDEIKQLSYEICNKHNVTIKEMETDKDHIHYFIEDYKGFASCFDETMEDLSPEEVYDFCDGYDSFQSWAECNL
jgi:hypothetical protein